MSEGKQDIPCHPLRNKLNQRKPGKQPSFTCWISFAPGIHFYLLLNPYLGLIYFLYLELYVFGDDALIS